MERILRNRLRADADPFQSITHDPRPTTHDPRPTTHDPRLETQKARLPTHDWNPGPTTWNPEPTIPTKRHSCEQSLFRSS